MAETILVDFHCHSIFSDGELAPEAVASKLAAAGVRFAALTDHDSIDGFAQFENELNKHGIPCISGVELTTQHHGNEVHLLGYGFDPENPELNATLASLRQTRSMEVHSIAGSIRKSGNVRSRENDASLVFSAAPNGHLEIKDAIRLIHHAGGLAFLAHPVTIERDPVKLEALVEELKNAGMDGIEVQNASFTVEEQEILFTIAKKHALLVSAGTDYHSLNGPGSDTFGVALDRDLWNQFRKGIFASDAKKYSASLEDNNGNDSGLRKPQSIRAHHFRRRSYVLRIVLPTLFAIALFLVAFWGFILPSVEQTLLDRKKEMIRELTNSAWSILVSYHADEQSGILTREEAQKLAADRIESLRYGPEGKDYFWIQDSTPRMIMHPYRTDLNNQDLGSLTDTRGVPIFVEFASVVKREGEGYVDYVWQWKDDPQRLEPKESFVKGFEPWDWIIGTGIYIDDVQVEITKIEKNLVITALIVFGVIVILLLFVLQQSLRIEKERQEVLNSLHDSTERYHSLIEATTEGTLLVLDNRCRYANPIFLQMTGYSSTQLEYLEMVDVLPFIEENDAIWQRFQTVDKEEVAEFDALEGKIKRADGTFVECVMTLNPIQISKQDGYILLAKEISRQPKGANYAGLAAAAQHASVGIFRACAAKQGKFLEVNSLVQSYLPTNVNDSVSPPALADLFSEPEQYDQYYKHLQSQEEIPEHVTLVEGKDGIERYLALSARLVRDKEGQPEYIDGTIKDISNERKLNTNRDELIGKLQSSLLFLHEPLDNLGKDVLICKMDTSIEKLAAMMTARKLTAALVESEAGIVIGMVTDQDLRSRVVAVKGNMQAPIHTIMSAPLVKVTEQTPIYEALMVMEEKGVRHLAVENTDGQFINIVDAKTLVQFHRYGAVILTREIRRAETQEDVAQFCEHIPHLVESILESSTRPRFATGMLASIADAATVRLIELAITEVGEPPADFTFISMGSQGRQEQTLFTDQDNGIIFQPEPGDDDTKIQEYFLTLGAKVNDGLFKAGYDYCQGKVMANTPLWCKSITEWQKGFTEWVFRAEPQELINICIFLDFRSVFGKVKLADELWQHVITTLQNENALFPLLAQNALSFKPPLRLIGNIYLGKSSSEHAGEINLKDAMIPIVNFARLYALENQLRQTNTIERIEALAEHHIISPSSRDEITASFDFLMQLRLQKQVQAIQEGKPHTNSIHPGQMGYIQQEMLKQAFEQISAIQKKISYDFLGGM